MPPESQDQQALDVFFSYTHEDEELKDRLAKHLSILKRRGVISVWHDRQIGAGREWAGEISDHLDRAHIILLLVSADFLASDYCYDIEMKRALERHEAKEARVIPIILKPVDWQGAPFSKLQALPKNGKPVTSWANIDEAFLDITGGIRLAAQELQNASTRSSTPKAETGNFIKPPEISPKIEKTKWIMVISATINEIDKVKAEAIVAHLRKLSGDAELTMARMEPGSVIIYFEGSVKGFLKVKSLFESQKLEIILNFEVLGVKEDGAKEAVPPLNEEIRKDCVFISYAHEDLETIRKIVDGLRNRNLNVWFDKEHLGPGRWRQKIIKVITHSRYFIICISQAALRKTGVDKDKVGFQDEELNTAYEIAQAQPEKEFTIVPVRLEDCGRGDFRLTSFQQYDLFDDLDKGLDRLAVDLGGISLSDTTARDERAEDEKIIEGLMGKTETAIYADDFKGALAYLNSIIAKNPNEFRVWLRKGAVLGKLGRHEEALTTFDKALEIKLDDSKALLGKGLTLSQLGFSKDAILAWDKALEIDPGFSQVWEQKGITLVRLNRHEEALAALEKALKVKPDGLWSWHGKGAALIGLGRYEEALAAYNKALEIKPDLLESLIGKGIALTTLGRHEEALETCNKALEIDPDDEKGLILKNNLLKKLN